MICRGGDNGHSLIWYESSFTAKINEAILQVANKKGTNMTDICLTVNVPLQ